jgi:hypothetical protein
MAPLQIANHSWNLQVTVRNDKVQQRSEKMDIIQRVADPDLFVFVSFSRIRSQVFSDPDPTLMSPTKLTGRGEKKT